MLDLMMYEVKPLLAARESPDTYSEYFTDLIFPVIVSPKADGIRGLVLDDVMTRKLEKVPSIQVQMLFRNHQFSDGELYIGNPNREEQINLCQEHIMSVNKPGDVYYGLFDSCDPSLALQSYYKRLETVETYVKNLPITSKVNLFPHEIVNNVDEFLEMELKYLEDGWEGMMGRSPYGIYKWGRSTFKEQLLIKCKRFEDDEALLVGLEEGTINTNKLVKDNLGFAKRSKAKAGLVNSSMVGTFIVLWKGKETKIGPGKFTHEQLKHIWEHKEEYINKQYLKFQYFKYGSKNTERFNKALCFRHEADLPEESISSMNIADIFKMVGNK